MNVSCDTIKDLLPLYVEKLTSKSSDALIEEHTAGCAECAELLQSLQCGVPDEKNEAADTAGLQLVRRGIRKRKTLTALFAALLVFIGALTAFTFLTRPVYLSYSQSGISVRQTADGEVYASFSRDVTAYSKAVYEDAGKTIIAIEAWTSPWDKLLGKDSPAVIIVDGSVQVDTVFYCDYKDGGRMVLAYGEDPYPNGGGAMLPRLVLGYYFTAAAVAAAALLIILLLLRRQDKPRMIAWYAFLAPVSYMLSHLLLAGGFVSYSATRDFIMIVIGTAAVYAALCAGSALWRQRRRDAAC